MFNTSIDKYKQTMNSTDNPVQLSTRAVKSILLYCQDWDNSQLPLIQRKQALTAGQILCDAIINNMLDDIPEKEAGLLLTIFTQTSIQLNNCMIDSEASLVECERALIKVLDILESKKS